MVTAPAPVRAPSRGRVDKRVAILEAAVRVFARQGYADASVDDIAAEAGVAKPTVYNHLGDKANLFRTVLSEIAADQNAKNLAALAALPTQLDDPADLRPALEQLGEDLLSCMASENYWAIQRLLVAEITRFPDLVALWHKVGPEVVADALAGRLARLAHAGYLTLDDPLRAAGQFVALISYDLPSHSVLGTQPFNPAVRTRTIKTGVETFLRAFAAQPVTRQPE